MDGKNSDGGDLRVDRDRRIRAGCTATVESADAGNFRVAPDHFLAGGWSHGTELASVRRTWDVPWKAAVRHALAAPDGGAFATDASGRAGTVSPRTTAALRK